MRAFFGLGMLVLLLATSTALTCPVRVLERALEWSETPQLTVENVLDATPLSGYDLQLSWLDGKDGAQIGSETLPLPAIPPKGRAPLAPRTRPDYAADAAYLHITVRDGRHAVVGEDALPVHAPPAEPSTRYLPPPQLQATGDQWRITAHRRTWTLQRGTGQLISLQYDGGLINLFGPLLDAPATRDPGGAPTGIGPWMDLSGSEPPRCALQQPISSDREAGGIWRMETRGARGDWPDYAQFLSAWRVTVDAAGRCTIHYAHVYLGRDDQRLPRWGAAIGLRAPRRLVWHGLGPTSDTGLPGVYELALGPMRRAGDFPETVAVLAAPSSVEGLAIIPDPACGLRVAVDGEGRATLGLAPRVAGPPIVPREIRTVTGALRLSAEADHWWRTPPPGDWPECDDGDDWPTSLELARNTNPFLSDSDGDGVRDSDDEVPLDPDRPRRRVPSADELALLGEPEHRGDGWVWVEAESAVESTGATIERALSATTSHGACLSGFRNAGDAASFAFRLASSMDRAALVLRYALDGTATVYLQLRFTHAKGCIERDVALDPTGGWGASMPHWRLMEVPLGPVQAGVVFVDWTAVVAGPGVNLDGFYLLQAPLRPRARLSGNVAPPPR